MSPGAEEAREPGRARITVEVDGVTTVVFSVRLEDLVLERVQPDELEIRNGAEEVVSTRIQRQPQLYVFRLEGLAEADATGQVANISRQGVNVRALD